MSVLNIIYHREAKQTLPGKNKKQMITGYEDRTATYVTEKDNGN
jgi:hypothetical protein